MTTTSHSDTANHSDLTISPANAARTAAASAGCGATGSAGLASVGEKHASG